MRKGDSRQRAGGSWQQTRNDGGEEARGRRGAGGGSGERTAGSLQLAAGNEKEAGEVREHGGDQENGRKSSGREMKNGKPTM